MSTTGYLLGSLAAAPKGDDGMPPPMIDKIDERNPLSEEEVAASDGLIDETARIGRIIAVSPAEVVALLEMRPSGAGPKPPPIEMGGLVKLRTRGSIVFGMVNALRVPLPSLVGNDDDLKIMEIELLGEMLFDAERGHFDVFRRGVSIFPAIECPIYSTTADDVASVFAPKGLAAVPIGSIYQADTVPAYIRIDDMMGKHFSIVGTTGSGKSCAVATILRAIIDHNPNAHLILLDPHDEYSRAFTDRCVVLSPDEGLRLPYWLLNFDELSELVFGMEQTDTEQRKILAEIVLAAKQPVFQRNGIERTGSVDTPVPYRMSDALAYLERAMGSLNRPESVSAFQTVKSRILTLQTDARYAFIFAPSLSVRDEMAEILAHLFRIPVDGKPITILDISAVPSEVLNVIVSLVCRLAFDFAMWSDTTVPITIVCEEAHRYAPRDRQAGFEPAKRSLSRIAKEGRKYGVSLCVVSQRPSDLAPSLLSECNTMFALRMTNHEDQDILRDTVPEASLGLMDFLPALRNGEAIAVGEGVSMPMRIAFAELPDDCRPKSSTASFTSAWSEDSQTRWGVRDTVERWRRGVRSPA